MVFASIVCSQRSKKTCKPHGHLHEVWCGLVAATVGGAEVGVFQRVEECVFVVFCYVKNEWSKPGVLICVVLAPSDCSSDCDDDAGACFADFYG